MLLDQLPLIARPQLYLDPGSGSFLIQLLLAVGLGAGVAFKMYWTRIKNFFGGKKDASQPEVDAQDDDE